MKPVFQDEFYDPTIPEGTGNRGNCLQAAVASLFELELHEVPHFISYGDGWWFYFTSWLAKRNLGVTYMSEVRYFGPPYIRCGKSPRGNWHHAVVYQLFDMVHDPHPDGTGLEPEEVEPHGMYYIYPLDYSKMKEVN